MSRNRIIDVLIPHGYKPPKKDVDAAWVLARHHKTVVSILRPVNKYKVKTPDFRINNQDYELKVITSAQARQLLHLLKVAKSQSQNIIIDIRKTKITEKRAVEICQEFIKSHKKYKISLMISVSKVFDIKI